MTTEEIINAAIELVDYGTGQHNADSPIECFKKGAEFMDKHWQENIGKYAYRVKDSKIVNSRIDEGRVSIHLNTGSDRHGRLLDPIYEYRFEREKEWVKIENIFFTKEDFLNAL